MQNREVEQPGMKNTIMVIFPYRHHGTWVFDDDQVDLVHEPFVSGIPEMIDVLVKDIANVDEGFKLLFSANPFPGYQVELIWFFRIDLLREKN